LRVYAMCQNDASMAPYSSVVQTYQAAVSNCPNIFQGSSSGGDFSAAYSLSAHRFDVFVLALMAIAAAFARS